ncbi:MAG: SUMF1/EgtB/PvdO family nonheme iron enzyme [Bacteroidota bacterium]
MRQYLSTISLLCVVFFFFGWRFSYSGSPIGKEQPNPPNTLKVADNFYVDETELTNIAYLEYLYWIGGTYGETSEVYLEALPDTTVWEQVGPLPDSYLEGYLRHPTFHDYPVVGISLEQAIAYSDWRTERVAESYLLHLGLIRSTGLTTPDQCFTIDRYLQGNFDWIIKSQAIYIPVFRLPTIEEWEQFAGKDSPFIYGVDSTRAVNRKNNRRYKFMFNSIENPDRSKDASLGFSPGFAPIPVNASAKNVNDLYHVIGNVAELVQEADIVKGGSWKQAIDTLSIDSEIYIDEPTAWVGFRNVCSYQALKPE